MKRQIVVGLVAAAAAAAAVLERPWGTAQAQQAGDTPQTMPSLADIMSGTQWRHLKLAYSGKVTNWAARQLRARPNSTQLFRGGAVYPTFKSIPLAQLIKDESGPPLADLGKAIERKNSADFIKAFGKLTDACNRCHQAAGISFIVIRIPTSSPYSNQLFPPGQQ